MAPESDGESEASHVEIYREYVRKALFFFIIMAAVAWFLKRRRAEYDIRTEKTSSA